MTRIYNIRNTTKDLKYTLCVNKSHSYSKHISSQLRTCSIFRNLMCPLLLGKLKIRKGNVILYHYSNEVK